MVIIPSLGLGGVETIVKSLVSNLDKEKFYVELVTFKNIPKDSNNLLDVKVNIFKINNIYDLIYSFLKLLSYSRNFRIIHAHTFYPIIISRMIKIFNRSIIIVCSEHCTINKINFKYKILYNLTNYFSDLDTNVSEISADSFIKLGYLKNMKVVYNGIEKLPICNETFIYDEVFNRFDKVFLTVGRLVNEKNHLMLIKIFNKFLKNCNENIGLIIVGDGPLRQELHELVSNLELDEKIIFTGNQHNVSNFFRKCDYFILTSITEALPTVLLEAISCQKIIVSTNCGGIPEILGENYPHYILAQESSIDDDVFKIKKVINLNSSEKNEIIEFYEKTFNRFSLKNFINSWEKIYKGF